MLSTLIEILGLVVLVVAFFTLSTFAGLLALAGVLTVLGYMAEDSDPEPPKPTTGHGYL